ncbi:conserved hypothetical protein [Talaromyces stipitatus ATCC 10500]|uniref:NADH:ubiquinone oxidoreductase intermediate-associated protein 30 domain-containing protein n=1 Tax=Talaromyces stipitatus (strain ATCC 10500 / CBS 375.48 / QM 6759 / NRRL 1006) TaxID=441959 RepID=B8M3T6_TALSN|nr:uncharacterized protein TSTA_038840 [Talaromyces stipitatus ATCC 10500]EED20679.1 conserved hypothetical protein [Talaromyces stipitatus ATCC 10500]
MTVTRKYLFGGDTPWSKQDWTTCDDRIRGGASASRLSIKPSTVDHIDNQPYSSSAFFHGFLDITTLGGAGFASQRNTTYTLNWHLEKYDGIEFIVGKSDGKRYSFVLKDEMLPKRPDGREQSSLNWEYEFVVPATSDCEDRTREGTVFRAKWCDFEPTYRGKPQEGLTRRILPRNIKRITLMMRSFFGMQSGDFEVEIKSIAVFKEGNQVDGAAPLRQDGEDIAEKLRNEYTPPLSSRAESFGSKTAKETDEPKRRGRPNSLLLRLLSSCCGG